MRVVDGPESSRLSFCLSDWYPIMDDPKSRALVPAPSRSLDFPRSTRLALPVVGAAALVWAGKKAIHLLRTKRAHVPVRQLMKQADHVEPVTPHTTWVRAVYIRETTRSVVIRQEYRDS
jgi:hypothetical protein